MCKIFDKAKNLIVDCNVVQLFLILAGRRHYVVSDHRQLPLLLKDRIQEKKTATLTRLHHQMNFNDLAFRPQSHAN